MLKRLRNWLIGDPRGGVDLEAAWKEAQRLAPAPMLWLIGKTQSGKSSIVRTLTGAEEAAVGDGFRPKTKDARQFDFPNADTPLLRFLDTRGLGEAHYNAAEDVALFSDEAHAAIAVVRALDHAQQPVLETLQSLRRLRPRLPIVLAFTALHDAYPGRPHPVPNPFASGEVEIGPETPAPFVEDLSRLKESIAEQERLFTGLFDRRVLLDFTKTEYGFEPADLGHENLKNALAEVLPEALAQSVLSLSQAVEKVADLLEKTAAPYILSSSAMASVASASPIPWVDIPVVAAIQTRLAVQLGELYGQPASVRRLLDLLGAVGAGMAVQQGLRGLMKFVPGVGMVVGAAAGYSATYALGKACCWYFAAVRRGVEPTKDEVRRFFRDQTILADRLWKSTRPAGKQKGADR